MERVAIINTVLDSGSIGNLTMSLYQYGKAHGYEPYVFYGRGMRVDNDHQIKIDFNFVLFV